MVKMSHRTGGQILVDQLIAQGVDRLTCVPGESYLAVLDALYDASIDVLVCRNEPRRPHSGTRLNPHDPLYRADCAWHARA